MVGYRADVDGLRTLAVLAVVLNHGNSRMPGGFVGVDGVFVISGFVICRQLAEQIPEDGFHWNQFLMTRIRRILPLQLVVTAVRLLVSWLLLLSGKFSVLTKLCWLRVCWPVRIAHGFAEFVWIDFRSGCPVFIRNLLHFVKRGSRSWGAVSVAWRAVDCRNWRRRGWAGDGFDGCRYW